MQERTVSLPEIVHGRIFVWKMLMRAMPSASIAEGLTAGRCVSGMSPWLATNMNQFHMYVIPVRTRKYVLKTDIYTVQSMLTQLSVAEDQNLDLDYALLENSFRKWMS